MPSVQLVVMAAGIGSRFGGVKQVEPVGPAGETLLEYSVHDAVRAGFDGVVFVVRREIEDDFREAVGRHVEPRVPTTYVHQSLEDVPAGFSPPDGRAKPWGTGHALLAARDVLHSPFAVINADDFYGREAFELLHGFLTGALERGSSGEHVMVGYRLDATLSDHGHVSRGVCETDGEGLLRKIVERYKVQRFPEGVRYLADGNSWTDIDPASVVSMNCWGFTPDFLPRLERGFGGFLETRGSDPGAEFGLPDQVGAMIRGGEARVTVLESPARWFGMTNPEDAAAVRAAVASLIGRGVYPERLRG